MRKESTGEFQIVIQYKKQNKSEIESNSLSILVLVCIRFADSNSPIMCKEIPRNFMEQCVPRPLSVRN